MEIIPAIDIIEGKCVRLTKGDYAQKKVYNEDPLEVAKSFEDIGIRRLHVVDLDGAKAQHIVNHKTLEKIATKTNLVVDFGGGLKTSDDLRIAFECGAQMVTGGSIAVKNPDEFTRWIEKYGGEKIILGADVNNEKIAVSGWQEGTNLDLLPFIKSYTEKGITQVICTDISKDGMLQGTNVLLYKKIQKEFPSLHLIASGGVSQISDIQALSENNIHSVIVGKAIYEGKISMEELKKLRIEN
ncbi:MAG: 1-(5-phosphoribosyl)-5-[(5-phosphoribosylamino)methylideneamino]imidazole-4-carboxamide isomerase [Prevotellaceae bacterium]|jgi:phosphoribosylformimino-5-aminoimidazole carboxamide ribotide isomerase|nr:1-(5-phosphoribosyl)-5-[(5-phosphoribosylamino)methylideneamino]imidazole-4-carboxamide isomerase [Prevotellaceae bacterium]